MINSSIFKAYDIRGIYGKDIDEDGIEQISKAIYTFFVKKLGKQDLKIVLGCDMRISTPSLFERSKKTFAEAGATVIDVGLVATPTLYFASLHYDYDGGVMITASHNPKEYNGLKFVVRQGNKLLKIGKESGMEEVKNIALQKQFLPLKASGKIIKRENVVKDEIEKSLSHFDFSKMKKLKIIIDSANGMGILYLNEIFKHIPADIIRMNEKLDGTFPAHEANPLKFETLKDIQKKIVEEKADLGIAPDADGDRIFFLDEKGQIIPAAMTTSIIADQVLEKNPGELILVDIRYIRNVQKVVKDRGGKISISKVGHALITKQMADEDGIFAGESSGHYFFRETGYAENSGMVVLYVLNAMNRENKPLSEIVRKYHSSPESGEVNFELSKGTNVKALLSDIEKGYTDGESSWLDGLSVTYPDWRFNIRTSNTEPLMRLNVEAANDSLVKEKFEELKKKIMASGATMKS
ncbi:MAG: phosphomannomutase/phosphoglucomutase [bacterium]|nr:phosphomannomutase/phosphoglucomutase [bacterium]